MLLDCYHRLMFNFGKPKNPVTGLSTSQVQSLRYFLCGGCCGCTSCELPDSGRA